MEKPCTSLATHQWSLGTTLYLSLPDTQGWYDCLRWWHCRRCDLETWATGAIDVTTPPLSPVEWEARADSQAEDHDPYSQAVQQQERWGRERTGLSKRLKIRVTARKDRRG